MKKKEMKRRIRQTDNHMRELKKRVAKLECPHKHTKYTLVYIDAQHSNIYYKVCISCGKVLKIFSHLEKIEEETAATQKNLTRLRKLRTKLRKQKEVTSG